MNKPYIFKWAPGGYMNLSTNVSQFVISKNGTQPSSNDTNLGISFYTDNGVKRYLDEYNHTTGEIIFPYPYTNGWTENAFFQKQWMGDENHSSMFDTDLIRERTPIYKTTYHKGYVGNGLRTNYPIQNVGAVDIARGMVFYESGSTCRGFR